MPILLVGNKLDAAKYPEEAMKAYHELLPEAEPRMLSALDERQVAELKADLLALMPEGPFFYPEDYAKSDQTFGEWVAEILREEAMKRLWHEVPYAVATKVEEVAERENGVLYIKAILYVERPSQKAIVIGEGGRKIKEIGQATRKLGSGPPRQEGVPGPRGQGLPRLAQGPRGPSGARLPLLRRVRQEAVSPGLGE